LSHTPSPSIEKVMGHIPTKGWSRTEKCTILITSLIKEVKAVILEINQHRMILHS